MYHGTGKGGVKVPEDAETNLGGHSQAHKTEIERWL